MTPQYVNHGGELNWLLDDLVNRVPQVSRAVMLTQDGLAIGASAALSREDAEHLAAMAAGFQSMARGAGQHFGGGRVRQTIIEMESAFLFVSAAGQGTCLAVLSTGDADVGMVAYEMAVLVRRSNEHLGVAPRPAPAQPGYGPPQPGPGGPVGGGYGGGQQYPLSQPQPVQPQPVQPNAAPPWAQPGGRPPSMSGTGPAGSTVPPPSYSPASAPMPQLSPQGYPTPSQGPAYNSYPTPTGRPGPVSYPE